MSGHHFTWGAHLLLWVFPLVLVIVAVLAHWRGRRGTGEGR